MNWYTKSVAGIRSLLASPMSGRRGQEGALGGLVAKPREPKAAQLIALVAELKEIRRALAESTMENLKLNEEFWT